MKVLMKCTYSKRIAPYVEAELANARRAESVGDTLQAFAHLERTHVIGQESTFWYVKVHVLMLVWGFRNRSAKEAVGQVVRVVGATTKTVFGMIPQGNTGGANVSPFRKIPIAPDSVTPIHEAKFGV
jgi:hypothetical protein